jgi:uncharacterized protein (TIGR03437 family)
MTNWRAIAVLALFYAPVLAAQTTANWTVHDPQTPPPARQAHAMAYDSAHGQIVLFGGLANFTQLNDTWTWDGSNWSEKMPQTSPSPRTSPAMVYDSAHGQVVLFGGTDETNNYAGLNDTWVWDGANWTEKMPQTSPPGRGFSGMVYDSAHGRVVLFGGEGSDFADFNDTWTWDGSNWSQATPQTSPAPRDSFAMAYDSAHGYVVLFGGSGVSAGNPPMATVYNDTWVWDGSNWTEESPQATPPARYDSAAAYDSAHDQVVLFGGRNPSASLLSLFVLGDTWVWGGSNWTQESPQSSPPARYGQALAYDSTHDQVVLFGGLNPTESLDADTWTWFGGALPPTISGVVSASAFGGFSSVAPGSWVEIYGTNLASSTQGWTGADFTGNNAPTALNGVSVSIGGQAAFVDYVSAGQVNAQLPSNIATGGVLQLTVTNANGASAPVNLTVNPTEPGLLAPASFLIGKNQYVVAQHSDGTYVLPVGAISGVASSPAKPGEIVVIYGVGFGSVVPNIPAGEIATESNQLSASFEVLFGKTPATLPYFGLAPSFVGLYQFNVTVPAVANNDLVPFTFNLGGVAGTQTLFTAVQQ